jgi:hypothetical protein
MDPVGHNQAVMLDLGATSGTVDADWSDSLPGPGHPLGPAGLTQR